MKRLVICSADRSIGDALGSRIGAEIVVVEDWPRIFEVARGQRPDGLVVDLRSGLQASTILSDLASDDRVAGVPVLLIDPSRPQPLVEELRGAWARLATPFTDDALAERVGNLLEIPFRRACRVLVRLEVENQAGRFFGLSADLSVSGIFVESDQELRPGQQLHLRFCVPPKASRIAVVGRVVRVRPGETQRFGYGIVFASLDDDDRALLRAFVER